MKPEAADPKTIVPIVGALPMNSALARLVQLENAELSMVMILEGMVTLVRLMQP